MTAPPEALTAAADLLAEAMTVDSRPPTPGELRANRGLALLMVEAAEPVIRAAERERILNAARSRTVLMSAADGSEVAAVSFADILTLLGDGA